MSNLGRFQCHLRAKVLTEAQVVPCLKVEMLKKILQDYAMEKRLTFFIEES
jgi:hypothetical protein